MRSAIIIPTYNGGLLWKKVAQSINKHYKGPVIVIDSGSTDNTINIAENNGFEVYRIKPEEFNHGRTRNYGVSLASSKCDIAIFLTQDAILQNDEAVSGLVEMIQDDDKLAAVYGKQLPHDDANPLATHARYFNYADSGYILDEKNAKALGLKSVFMSNSFAAYRVSTFQEIGGFANNTILCEDMLYAATALSSGFKVGYQPNSRVQHSHNYSAVEEFRRYFDIGVFHMDQSWIGQRFGGAQSAGSNFIRSELTYLAKNAPYYIPLALINNSAKLLGYKLGKKYNLLPRGIVRKLSMHKKFWK
ncbi:glycosyltransferase family 2 protein [Buttiauxella noackiae]|uniref:glycosyltransferase family 2 protein n=1 Tax=Buttiauxella noackiae TaxID=82992 RepID=UPI000551FD71|nr:glycosyltransferase [Buttiauxella noackiae]